MALTGVKDTGAITEPAGFTAAGVFTGVKRMGPDLGLVVSDRPAVVAGRFTSHRMPAAPVSYTREVVARGRAQAIVANSGSANAATGRAGLEDAREMGRAAARALGIEPELVAVASTGVVGSRLPMDRILPGIERAARERSRQGGAMAAKAILTTDSHPKEVVRRVSVRGRTLTWGGMAKGSGMIHPNLATMLCFVTTDAGLHPEVLDAMLGRAVADTLNLVTVDGDQSTNDMVLALANGAQGVHLAPGDPELEVVEAALAEVLQELAYGLVEDGEGATRVLRVRVRGAASVEDARRAARTIAGSQLVKAAVYGGDPNWGRVYVALGNAGVPVDPLAVTIRVGDVVLMEAGEVVAYNEAEARFAMMGTEVRFAVDMGAGPGSAEALGCDLTEAYVVINSKYRT